MSYYYRELREDDLPDIAAIYNYYVLNTSVTFHTHQLLPDEMRDLVFFDNPKYKTFVIADDRNLYGYLIISQHKKREAYDGTAEVSIYLKPECTGKGIGSQVLKYAEETARKSSIHVLIATICGENRQSIKLFEKNGYIKCAHYKEVGKKFNQWLDVVAFQKII
ncbi:MAG TPA: GNAT family N-acetyltransferase [Bacteroidales bacterium]